MVSLLFPCIIREIMKRAVYIVQGANPRKIKLMLWTSETKIPPFLLPPLSGTTTSLVANTKVNWKINIVN